MSAAPDPGTILDILSTFDQGLQNNLQPDDLLAQALPAIVERIPGGRFARVYRLIEDKAVLQAATDSQRPTGAYRPVSTTPLYAQALQHHAPASDAGLWVAPLFLAGTTFGLLEIGVETTPELSTLLQLLIQPLSQTLSTAAIRDLVRRQSSASTELTHSKTFIEMAGAVARHMLQGGQFVTIDLVDYDANGRLAGLRVIASANREQAFDASESLPLTPDDIGEPLNRVFAAAAPVLANGIASNNSISVRFRKWLASHRVEAVCCLPMRRGAETFGIVVINSVDGPLYFTHDELLAYQNLADQISALVQVHNLMEESAHSQDISERQAKAFSELSYSQDFTEMAGIIAQHMLPAPGRFLTIGSLQYDAGGNVNGFRMLASANREHAYSLDMAAPFSWEGTSPRVQQMLRDGVFQIGETRAESPESLGPEVYTWLETGGVQYYMNIPMTVLGRPVAILSVLSKHTPFTRDEINAFRNLADQVAALIHTRDLLRQTEDTLKQVQVLYEVNRSILAAQDTLDVLRALRLHLAPDAAAIADVSVGYDAEDRFATLMIHYLVTPDSEQVVEMPLHDAIGAETMAALQRYWEQHGAGLSIVEDTRQPDAKHPLKDYLQAQQTLSFVAIPLVERGKIREFVSISFGEPRRFDSYMRLIYESLSDQIGIVFQNQRLLKETQISAAELSQQVEALQNINELAITLSTIQDEKTLFERSSEMLVKTLKVDHCGIVLSDPGGITGTLVGEYPARGAIGAKLDLTNSALYGQVWEHLQPVVIDDIDSQISETSREMLKTLGVKSLLILPLVMQDKLIGTIGLDFFTSDKHFTREMEDLARTMTAQIGVAIQNTRLLADAQRYGRQLQQITAFSQAIQTTLELATILNIALSFSARIITLHEMKVLLYEPVSGQLRSAAQFVNGNIQITLKDGEVVPIEGTNEGRVWRSREFLYLPGESRARDPRQPYQIEPGSDMIAPLQSHGRMLGLLFVSHTQPHAYDETDFAVFRQMADLLAVAIENAEAYGQSQRQARNEALVNDIATRLQRQTDIQSMLDITMNELGKALGARRARIRLAAQPGDQDQPA